MRANGAELIADNLADGASEETLDAAEAELGFRLHPDLRALWSIHDGQREEMNGFVEIFDLVSAGHAASDRETVEIACETFTEYPDYVAESGATASEIASKAWVLLAVRDSDGVAVENGSGRVFSMEHDDLPSLRLIAPSIVEWLRGYAARVEAGDYAVEEGFGDAYLALRDREAERREAERAAHERSERARHATMSPAALVLHAIQTRDDDLGREAIGRAGAEALDALFANAPAELIATILRPMLRDLVLSPDRWRIVAEGGERIGNHAVRDHALARSRGSH